MTCQRTSASPRRNLAVGALLLLLSQLWGCANRVPVHLVFPSEADRAATVSVHVWVLDADAPGANCMGLETGEVFPYDPGVAAYLLGDAVFLLSDPVVPELTGVRRRRSLLYVEAVGFDGDVHLSGCTEVRISDGRDVVVALVPRRAGGDCSGLPDGVACDDGFVCTLDDRCSGGACSGVPLDCSGFDSDCGQGMCDEAVLGCTVVPVADGSPCDAGFCQETATCFAGFCSGTPRDCSAAASDPCEVGVCDAVAEACVAMPLFDGSSCDDGMYCTLGEWCLAGVCGMGSPIDCSFLDDACNVGSCDDVVDSCVAQPLPGGTPCSDGMTCTSMDACAAGVCTGIPGIEGPTGDPSCLDSLDNDCDLLVDSLDPDC